MNAQHGVAGAATLGIALNGYVVIAGTQIDPAAQALVDRRPSGVVQSCLVVFIAEGVVAEEVIAEVVLQERAATPIRVGVVLLAN